MRLGLGQGLGAGQSSGGLTIVRDGLVMQHKYNASEVQPLSNGAAYFVQGTDNDYIEIADSADLSPSSITVSAWVHHGGSAPIDNYPRIIDNDGDALGWHLRYSKAANRFHFRVSSDGSNDDLGATDNTYTDYNKWYHVVATYDSSGTIKMYVDGVHDGTDTGGITGAINNPSGAIFIGRQGNASGQDWSGYICNVGVWGRVLTQAEIKSIMFKQYADLTTSEKTSLVSFWNLDSTIDSTATLGHTVVYDNHYGGGDALGDNLIPNPECDSLDEWNLQNIGASDSVEVSTEQSYSGGSSIKIVGTASNDGIVNASINEAVVVGGLYRFEAWVYVETGVAELNPGDGPFGSYSPATDEEAVSTTTNQWEKLVTYAWADSTGTQIAFISQSTGTATTFYVDNVKVQRVNGNPGELK